MGLKDLLITPLYLILLSLVAFAVRPYLTNKDTRKYFLLALWIRFFGAIVLGLVYQFYYEGGDTFNYFTHGSKWIWEAFCENPIHGLSMIFGDIKNPEYFQYYSQIWVKRSDSAMFVVRIVALFDVLTLHTYSASALCFATLSFLGSWEFFRVLVRIYPAIKRGAFLGIFMLPSVVIWGSGIMKDSLTLGALLLAFSIVIRFVVLKDHGFKYWIVFILSCLIIYEIKVYVLVCFVPCIFVLVYRENINRIKSIASRALIVPVFGALLFSAAFLSTKYLVSEDQKYSFENIPELAMTTAYDIGFWTGKNAGSGYSLGYQDGSWGNLLSKLPSAINVALFRPYPWEVSNVLMALTSIESFALLMFFLYLMIFNFRSIAFLFKDPVMFSFFIFVCAFGFAVGVSTYNFGTLSRYRIPLLPLLVTIFVFLSTYKKGVGYKSQENL